MPSLFGIADLGIVSSDAAYVPLVNTSTEDPSEPLPIDDQEETTNLWLWILKWLFCRCISPRNANRTESTNSGRAILSHPLSSRTSMDYKALSHLIVSLDAALTVLPSYADLDEKERRESRRRIAALMFSTDDDLDSDDDDDNDEAAADGSNAASQADPDAGATMLSGAKSLLPRNVLNLTRLRAEAYQRANAAELPAGNPSAGPGAGDAEAYLIALELSGVARTRNESLFLAGLAWPTPPDHLLERLLERIELPEEQNDDGDEEEERCCHICLEEFGTCSGDDDDEEGESEHPVRLHCGHVVGDRCVKKWFLDRNTCAVCRRLQYVFVPPSGGRTGFQMAFHDGRVITSA